MISQGDKSERAQRQGSKWRPKAGGAHHKVFRRCGPIVNPERALKFVKKSDHSMVSSSKTKEDISDKIKLTGSLLEVELNRIAQLNDLLEIAKANFGRLAQELAQYQVQYWAVVGPTPIDKCPPEILSMVFQILSTSDHEDLNRLLLVCKRWHNIMVHNPLLWNVIDHTLPPSTWDVQSWARSTRGSIARSLERSHPARLEIVLDFSALEPTEKQLIGKLRQGFSDLPSFSRGGANYDALNNWLPNLYHEALENNLLTREYLPDYALDILGELVDPGGELMTRWAGFTLWFPLNQLASLIWDRLTLYPANISCLHLMNLEPQIFRDRHGEGSIPVWSLPQLKGLTIPNLSDWFQYLSFDPASLSKLSVEMSYEEHFFLQLASFNRLETLTLFDNGEPVAPSVVKNRISLPLLQQLVLCGDFEVPVVVEFNLPRLKRVEIKWATKDTYPPDVFVFQPSQVHWEPVFVGEPDWAETVMRGFLLRYISSEDLSVPFQAKGILLELLGELSSESALPQSWKTVSFHSNGHNLETVVINKIFGN